MTHFAHACDGVAAERGMGASPMPLKCHGRDARGTGVHGRGARATIEAIVPKLFFVLLPLQFFLQHLQFLLLDGQPFAALFQFAGEADFGGVVVVPGVGDFVARREDLVAGWGRVAAHLAPGGSGQGEEDGESHQEDEGQERQKPGAHHLGEEDDVHKPEEQAKNAHDYCANCSGTAGGLEAETNTGHGQSEANAADHGDRGGALGGIEGGVGGIPGQMPADAGEIGPLHGAAVEQAGAAAGDRENDEEGAAGELEDGADTLSEGARRRRWWRWLGRGRLHLARV